MKKVLFLVAFSVSSWICVAQTEEPPYNDIMFTVGSPIWSYRNSQMFDSFYLGVTNRTDHAVTAFKFRLSITVDGRQEFAKTITKRMELLPGDMLQFQVTELSGYIIGADLSLDDPFDYEVDVIQIWPNPNTTK